MKVALFTETYLPHINGVVTHVKSLKDGLEKLGHQVLIVTADKNAKKHYVKENVLHCPGIEAKHFYNYGVAKPISHTRLKYIKDFNPDIIHVHNEFGIGIFGILTAKSLQVPLVYTLHTMYDDYIYYVAPAPLIGAAKKISRKYFKLFAKSANAITGPSLKCTEYLKLAGINKKVHVIPNPVELDLFSPENISNEIKLNLRMQLNIANDVMIACFVGRIGKEKSVDILLEYWSKVITQNDKIHLMIIGEGPEIKSLKQMADNLQITNMVSFVGRVEHPNLPPYYAISDLYITASLSDTNSISMLEGMATGLPVLKRLDLLNEHEVNNGVTGFIFNSPEEMRKQLLKIKNMSISELQTMKKTVIESVRNSGGETLAKNLIEVYTPILKNKKKWFSFLFKKKQ